MLNRNEIFALFAEGKERGAEMGSSTGKRKSIKESIFAAEHAEVLKPIYKHHQAMQFSTNGHSFMWDAVKRKACVQMLLDAAKACHPREPTPVSRKRWRQN